jgi:hypothetical protein
MSVCRVCDVILQLCRGGRDTETRRSREAAVDSCVRGVT